MLDQCVRSRRFEAELKGKGIGKRAEDADTYSATILLSVG
jgi:hypothetical protein